MAHPHHDTDCVASSSSDGVASSSSARSIFTSYPPYDVFINHRGPDTKRSFATRLYNRLTSHRLQVFLDEREMEPGHEFPAQIEAAIEVASVHVAVFSATYNQSEWCLKELLLMEKSRGIILPVFYKVDPSDLRHGAYLDYLKQKQRCDPQTFQQKQRYDPQTLQNWANALKRSADLDGFPLPAVNGDEEELLEKLVQCVERKVRKTQLDVSKHPTGLAAKFKDFERKLLSQQKEAREARVVGIWGGGGIGKTTLAKEIFNRKKLEYSGASFLCDVREKASIKSLNILQSDLINHLRHRVVKIDSSDQGIEILQDYLTNYHALIILDDVDNADQLHAFLPIMRVLDPRSLILVTSRDKQALVSAKIADTSIYQLTGLDDPDSKKLFCLHAFSQPDPIQRFETLVDGFLTVCKGLPLSLKVVGGLVCGRNIDYWEAQLEGLHHLPREINKCLQISYQSLTDIEQQIFLDIACFSIGKDKDTWIRIWAESDWNGLVGFQNLISKCLVEVDGENKIRMHDHVRDLGRSIASQSGPRRLWSATMRDVHHLLEQSSDVRGIRIAPGSSSRDTSEMPFNRTSSQYMWSELRLFEGEGDFVNTILTRVKLPNLIWLSWTECPCSSLPSCIPTESLKVLEVAGRRLGRLWQSDHKVPLRLQELNINAPLLEFPKSLRKLVQLEKIVVECSMDEETHLATLPKELPDLCSLKYLMLKRCSKLQTIPESIGRLTNLQQINLSGCKNLESLPNSLGCLTNIQNIDLSGCESLTMLPPSLENLSNLLHINLSSCKSLGMLPISPGNFANLQRIELSGCISLEGLPDSFVDLATLQYVDLSQCEFLGKLPNSFGNLIKIQHIDMSGCKSLQNLPDSWATLTNLQRMDLSGCRRLERLPDTLGSLTNLHYINLCQCENLKKLPDFNPNFTNIQNLNLYGCKSLKMLPESIKNLTNLRHIDLSECTSLGSLPDSFVKLTNLQHIDFQGGKCLEMIPDSFGMLTKLQHIDLRLCSSLKMLPGSFGDLKSLQHLYLQGCSSLEKLPDSFGGLTNLKHINLSSCKSLKTLPNSFGNLLQLKHLDLTDCCSLNISSEPLKTAVQLYLGTNINQLAGDVVCLSKLELLHIEAPLLESLPPELGQLRGLKKLYLVDCTKLQYLPDSVGLLIQLNKLEIRNCDIQNLPPALLELTNLEELEVCKCPLGQLPFKYFEGQRTSSGKCMLNLKLLYLEAIQITEISFPRGVCPKLNHLRIRDCMEIAEVGALPTTLRILELTRCRALKNIGEHCFVPSLQNLDMRGCSNIKLEELPEPLLEALVTSLKVFRPPDDSHDGQDESLRGCEILISILKARRSWCSSCTEGVLPFLRQWERLEIL